MTRLLAKLLMAITMALSALGTPVASDVIVAGDTYLMVDDEGLLTMWAESNGQEGLQPAPTLIMGRVIVEADRQLHL